MASINYDEAAHLLRRAGFGGSPDDINSLVSRGREGAVDSLINYESINNSALDALLQRSFDDEEFNQFSDGVKAFYDDMIEHELVDKVLLLQWSEFGRRPNENNSLGTDHGTASSLFIIGNPVAGGLYGQQPSLDVTALDEAGNLKFTVDFRSIYATVIDRWLGLDSEQVLGARYENVGFIR